MKFTYQWLKDYLDTKMTADEIAAELTRVGLEIESQAELAAPVAAKIISVEDIPETHLHLLSVDDGGGTPRQVVCGAPNVRPGLVSVIARPGTIIEGNEIKVGKFRGYESDGMMCSERELGLSDNHDGIVEIDESKYKIGGAYGAAADVVYDAKVLPNRADYLAVLGIARDLAAAGAGAFNSPSPAKPLWTAPQARNGAMPRNAIIKSAQCGAYNFAEIHGIKIAPSSRKIAARLAAVGINPKNAPVDATNYICIDLGQPLHCFDADEINGDIIIRNANDGEEFVDLFDTKHILAAGDLVITDADGILALAGIVGGKRGMTTDKTTNIIIEAAYFDAVGTRKTRSRLGISTDASYRFERGVDPLVSPAALDAAVEIIMERCGGEVVALRAETNFAPVLIKYDPAIFAKKTGIIVPAETQKEILERLGYKVDADWNVIQSSWRVDDELPEKLVADIIRIYGYDKIQGTRDKGRGTAPVIDSLKMFLAKSRGLTEHNSYGFGNLYFEKIVSDKPNIKIANPVADTINTARNGLVANMLIAIAENDRFKRSNLNLFELGAVFDGTEPGQQHNELVIARTGIVGANIGTKHGELATIYSVRADLLALFPGAAVENDDAAMPWAHPFRAGRLVAGGKVVARFAELSPFVAKKFGIKANVEIGIVEDADLLGGAGFDKTNLAPKAAKATFIENHPAKKYSLAEFPMITRDFAFITDAGEAALITAVRAADSRISETNVFDVFAMPDGGRSVAFEIVIQPESNLSDKDILEIQNRVIAAATALGATLRDK